ncbi:MAG: phage major capsid protein [Comamonadaceae bacterium CG_4_10_14_3_um_filter_60_42]|nr:MAG: phage major capsid protein [Comamonadaceae bacterium CG_4_10_14_3_um_filter_60_42]
MSDDQKVDLTEVKKAVEGINKAWDEQKKAIAEHDAEIKKFGAALPETEAKLKKMDEDMARLQATADEAVLAIKRSQRVVTDANGNPIDYDAKAQNWADVVAVAYEQRPFDMNAKGLAEYHAAQGRYMRKGADGLSADERKALSVGGDPSGGYVVHPDMSGQIVTKVDETSPMRAYASIQVIGTDALEGLFDLERASAVWVGETQARSQTDTPNIGKWRIPVHELSAMPAATQKLLDDASINMESWLAQKVALEFALAENAAFVSGNGVEKPRGFLTYAAGTTLPGTIEQIKTTVNGDFAAAPAGGDALITALYSLKAPYMANATWFMNRTVAAAVRKLKDSDGSYLWQPGIAAGQPATILGRPLASFEDMPNIATNSLSIAVGDMRAAYQIVDRAGIRVLRDPYTAKPFVLFYTTKRTGGDVVNFEAIKLIKFSF